jgi:addiction module HigA family antidote
MRLRLRSLIIIKGGKAMSQKKTDRIPFPHPGETIREDFLKPLGTSINRLALELRVPATRMTEIVHGRRGVSADTALRLARYFNTTPKFWLNLQASYDLAVTAETKAEEIARTVRPRAAAQHFPQGDRSRASSRVILSGGSSPAL